MFEVSETCGMTNGRVSREHAAKAMPAAPRGRGSEAA